MMEWFGTLPPFDKVFFLSAVIGGAMFLVWLVLQFVGGDVDLDADVDVDVSDVSGESDVAFKILSFHSISSFLTMFGLVGLGVSRETNQGTLTALLAGAIAGVAASWVIAKLFAVFQDLQSSGTIDMNNALGAEGTVYLRIPANDVGKVRIAIQGHLKVYEAIADDGKQIDTGKRVQVVHIRDGHTLAVKAVE